jgi:hypothetical protein
MEATLTHQVMDERRECGEPHARARSPRLAWAGRGGAKGVGTRHAREWFAEIRPLALQGRDFLLLFEFFGYLAVKFRILPIAIKSKLNTRFSRADKIEGSYLVTDSAL